MGVLRFAFGDTEPVNIEFEDDDSTEVEIALERVRDGEGASFPAQRGVFVVPPGAVRWVSVEGLIAGIDENYSYGAEFAEEGDDDLDIVDISE